MTLWKTSSACGRPGDDEWAKRLVLDANILMRGVFGVRVLHLLQMYEATAIFCCADVCVADARKYVPKLAQRRGVDSTLALSLLDQILTIVQAVDAGLYGVHETSARERMSARDVDDWPVVATALLLDCAVRTEDQDFFGSGLATWTTQNVELYLRAG